ncbi:MAG: hypothetical protein D6734_05045, partial [Candidatus Schekmanbacteria bacterium]
SHPYKEFYILENNNPHPRTLLIPKAIYFKNDEKILDYMKSKDFDFEKEILLVKDSSKNKENSGNNFKISSNIGKAEIVEYKPNMVKIMAFTKESAYLLLCDTWFEGWEASIDGKKTDVIRGDYNFRAVYLPSGKHQVIFSFTHPGFYIGIITSFLSFSLIIALNLFFKKDADHKK